jgi:hypothetical protein
VHATITIEELWFDRRRARLKTVCVVNGNIVVDGEAMVVTTRRQQD